MLVYNTKLYNLTKGVPDLWDNVKEVIGYNIYEANVDDLEMPKEEEEGNQEEKI